MGVSHKHFFSAFSIFGRLFDILSDYHTECFSFLLKKMKKGSHVAHTWPLAWYVVEGELVTL